ncbi:hypothetical protein BaRGS_00023418, partial [Batillaria attramentaria]
MPPGSTFGLAAYDRGRLHGKDFGDDHHAKMQAADHLTKPAAHLSETGGIVAGNSSWLHTEKPEAKTAAEQAVCDMDIHEHYVRLAVQIHLLETGELFSSVQQLYLASQEIAESPEKQATVTKKLHLAEVSARSPKQLPGDVAEDGAGTGLTTDKAKEMAGDAELNYAAPEIAKPQPHENQFSATTPTTDNRQSELRDKVRTLTQQNQKLERRKKCRVCRKVDLATSGITFLPCGHFITCEDCAEKCDDCPACGKNIMGT